MKSKQINWEQVRQEPDLFLLIDAAQEPKLIEKWLKSSPKPQVRSLFENTPEARIPLYAAPLLLKLDSESSALDRILPQWLQHNTFLNVLSTALPMDKLIIHLQSFLDARLPSGEEALFRFYDPTVACLLDQMLSIEHYDRLMQPLNHWWYANDDGSFNALPLSSKTPRGIG